MTPIILFPIITVDGGWSDYSEWTPCSASCGGGSQERTRECDNPQPENGGQACTGTAKETRPCNILPCPGEILKNINIIE